MESVALLLGITVLIYGLVRIVFGILSRDDKKPMVINLVTGLIITALAIVIFMNLSLIGTYLPVVVGFYMVLCVISDLIRCAILWKHGITKWWISAIPAAIVFVLGLVIVLYPGFAGKTFGILTGISLLINGITSILSFLQLK